MPSVSPENILKVLNDSFTPVRTIEGDLIGVIPKIPDHDTSPYVTGSTGMNFELRIQAQVCVCVDPARQPVDTLPGFVAIDTFHTPTKGRKKLLPDAPPPDLGKDPDLGREV